MEFLKDILGEELYGQVDGAINTYNSSEDHRDKPVKLVNLTDGGYVSLEKYQTLETKSNGLQTQLNDANTAIKSYKEMDIDGIKESAKNWETKYATDTQELQKQIEEQQKQFAAERFIDTQKIKSPLSRKAIMQEFLSQGMEFKDGSFVGAEDYMKTVKEKYPDEFESDEPKEPEKKIFVRGTAGTHKPKTASDQEAYLKSKYGNNKYFNQ